jgi:hypothetical protein
VKIDGGGGNIGKMAGNIRGESAYFFAFRPPEVSDQ